MGRVVLILLNLYQTVTHGRLCSAVESVYLPSIVTTTPKGVY
jgi:hypothetical protein